MSTAAQPNCPACGASLASSPGGLCLNCLGRLALDPERAQSVSTRRLQRIGDYELLEEIARGGMGVVYRARQNRLKRLVAIKLLLRGDLADADARRRFELEAEAAAALQHPGIVTVFEVGESDGEHFIAMELIEGPSLDEVLREGPLEPERAVRCLHAIAEAVAYAHNRGVLHRDLKPSNILLDANDRPRITDFGMARLADSSASLTLAGRTFGSPNYMPPEQAEPFRGKAAPASDVFSLGAVLYHTLTGRPPFVGETLAATLRQVLENNPIPPQRLRPEIPADLETICLKCLEKEPAHRYTTASELAEDLSRFLRGEPVRARPLSAAARGLRWARRHPALASLSVGLTLALAAIAIITLVANMRLSHSRQEAEHRSEESRRNLIRSLVVTGNRYLANNDAQRALPWFLRAWELEPASALRSVHEVRLATTLQYVPELTKVWALDRRVHWAALSPDGSRVVCADGSDRVFVWSTDPRDTNQILLERGGPQFFARFSPDGKRIVASPERRTGLWDAGTGARIGSSILHQLHFDRISSRVFPQFSADGTRLLAANTNFVRLHDAADGKPLGKGVRCPQMVTAMALLPDAERCLIATADGRIALMNAITGEFSGREFRVAEPARVLSLNSNATRFAAVVGGDRIQVWSLDETNSVPIGFRHVSFTYQCDFVLNDRAILTTSYENSVRLWDANTGQLLHLLQHDGGVYRAIAGVSGRGVTGSWDGTAHVWDLMRGVPGATSLLIHGGPVLALDFDDANGRVLSGSFDGTLRLHTLRGGLPATVRGRMIANPVGPGRDVVRLSRTNAAVADSFTGELRGPWVPHNEVVRAIGIASAANLFATMTRSGRIALWKIASGEKVFELAPTVPSARDIELTPDGKRLLAIRTDGSVQLHDASDGREIGTPHANVHSVALSPDSRHIALVGGDLRVRIMAAGRAQAAGASFAPAGGAQSVRWSPDGRALAIASGAPGGLASQDQFIQLWSPVTGETISDEMRHQDDIRAIAFSADGRWLATGSEDYDAKIWDRLTSRALGATLRHNAWVVALAFSPDNRILATGATDGTVRLWQVPSGEPIGPALRTMTELKFVTFSETGDALVIGMANQILRWDLALAPTIRSNLQDRVTLVSGMRLDREGSLRMLTARELSDLWRGVVR